MNFSNKLYHRTINSDSHLPGHCRENTASFVHKGSVQGHNQYLHVAHCLTQQPFPSFVQSVPCAFECFHHAVDKVKCEIHEKYSDYTENLKKTFH